MGSSGNFPSPPTGAVTPETLRSSLGRGGIGTPRGLVRYFSFPHTAAVTPESLRSSLGRAGIGTPRGFVRYFLSSPHNGGYTRVPLIQPGPRWDSDGPWVHRVFCLSSALAAAAGPGHPPDCVLARGRPPPVSPPHHGEVTRPWAAAGG